MNIDVIKFVQDYVGDDVPVTDESNLIFDLGLTSFDIAMILSNITEECGVTVDMEKTRGIKVVADLLNCIEQ